MTKTLSQRLTVYRRELYIRLKAFRFFLSMFVAASLIGAALLDIKYQINLLHAIYESIALMFFASSLDYPEGDIFFQILWIFYPLIGLILLADGLAGIGVTLKFGDPSTKEWNEEMAKVMSNHIVVVGVGNVGYNVVKNLVKTGSEILVIDKIDEEGREDEFQEYQVDKRIPTIDGDASKEGILEKANIEEAYAIIVLIDNDLLNLKIALRAKLLNPKIKVVLRMFDLEFGRMIQEKLGIDEVFSTSNIAAPFFVNAVVKKPKEKKP